MIRLLVFIALVLALGFGFAWLADRPGDLTIAWQGQRIETSLMVAVAAIVSLVAAALIVWWILRALWTSPHAIRRYFRANKRDRGYQALSTGLIAAGAGDAATAHKMTKRTKGLLNADQEPLIHLLDVQTALIEGRNDDARQMFEQLSEDPETRLLGLRGLYLEARRQGAEEAARHYAEVAAEQAPQLPWAGEAALANRTRQGRWDEALALLERQKQAGMYERKDAERKKAVLLTARAQERFDADPAGARDDALAALKLSPRLVPAATIAARALFREDRLKRGAKVLESVWREHQHPEIAEAYVQARPGDSAVDRLKRAQKLETLRPHNAESLFASARAALDAHKFELAREKAEAAARLAPREAIYLLLADIEEADTGDQGRVRHWLSQALRAPRDPAWTADGYVAARWEPVSPVTGRLDAFEWKVPVTQLASTIEHEAPEAAFERAIAGLPPVAPAPRPEPKVPAAGTTSAAKEPEVPETKPMIDVTPAPVASSAPQPMEVASAAGTERKAGGADPALAREAGAAISPAAAAVTAASAGQSPAPPEAPQEAAAKQKPSGNGGGKAAAPAGATAASPPKAGGQRDDAPNEEAASEEVEKEAQFLSHPPDDPGVDEEGEAEKKQGFRLF